MNITISISDTTAKEIADLASEMQNRRIDIDSYIDDINRGLGKRYHSKYEQPFKSQSHAMKESSGASDDTL